MERKSKSDIKKALEALKDPKGGDEKSVAAGGKGQNVKAKNSAAVNKTYRPKI